MERSDLTHPTFRILTFRDGQEVIAEDVETDVAARTRFLSAIDLCKTRDDAHAHHVELYGGSQLIDRWPASGQ